MAYYTLRARPNSSFVLVCESKNLSSISCSWVLTFKHSALFSSNSILILLRSSVFLSSYNREQATIFIFQNMNKKFMIMIKLTPTMELVEAVTDQSSGKKVYLVFYTLVNRPHNNCNFPLSLFRLPLLTSLEHMLSQISPTTSSRYQITYNHTNTKSLPWSDL